MYSEEMFFICFNEPNNTMVIGTSIGYGLPEYPIGQELLNFIELDLIEYDRRRNMLYEYTRLTERAGETDARCKEINQTIMNLYNKNPAFNERVHKPKTVKEMFDNHEISAFLLNTSESIKKHPYCFFCMDNDVHPEHGLDLLFFQNRLKELIEFCFDQSYNELLNQLTAQERFYIWKKRNLPPAFAVEYSENNCRTNTIFIPYRFTDGTEAALYSDVITQDTINFVKALRPQTMQLFYCSNPVQYAKCEFEALVKINAKMKRCKRCGKYFLLKGDYNTDYCDRLLPGEKLSCKKAAAISSRKKRVQEDLILKEYERAYKRNYARCSNHKITKEEFRIWVDDATQKRDIASKEYSKTSNPEVLQKFKEYLDNK